ncbi:unnamed protein product [Phytophthora fragariaefolia]|uniref:Unnamed protein product n=1 Tax=Phytophthora fragariaefolia TaxID=1490495 RepID=A0A9W7CZP1_9STRA|nr:unnamed protein product [Phytophthora fragariaefolia]
MADKAIHEKTVLKEEFPQARQLLCQWHVVTWLKKQAARMTSSVKKEVKVLMGLLVYARSKMEYDEARSTMKDLLGGDERPDIFGELGQLAGGMGLWGKIKDVIKSTFSIDELVTTLITLQEYAEDQYIAEYHRFGSRPHGPDEDPGLAVLAMQISPFAHRLVEEQHGGATSPHTNYNVELRSPGKVISMNNSTSVTYEVNIEVSAEYAIFLVLLVKICPNVLVVCCYTPTFSVAYKWLGDFYEALNNGQVVDFALSDTACFPGLSQVASVGAATLSQTSFADLATQVEVSTRASDDEVAPTHRASQSGTQPAGDERYEKDNDNEAASPVASVPPPVVVSCAVDQKDTKSTPKRTKNEELSAKRPLWAFAERPHVHGMTKAQRREKMKKEELQLALDLAEQYRTGKLKTPAKLEDVARLLDGPSFFTRNQWQRH